MHKCIASSASGSIDTLTEFIRANIPIGRQQKIKVKLTILCNHLSERSIGSRQSHVVIFVFGEI